jgi:hypothetical protein
MARCKDHLDGRFPDSGLIQHLFPSLPGTGSDNRPELQPTIAGDSAQQMQLRVQQGHEFFTGVNGWMQARCEWRWRHAAPSRGCPWAAASRQNQWNPAYLEE